MNVDAGENREVTQTCSVCIFMNVIREDAFMRSCL